MHRRLAWLGLALALGGCEPDLRQEIRAAGVFSPKRLQVGDDEVVRLGQLLFFDRELSGSRDVSCASCHLPELHAGDRRVIAVGHAGRLTRNTIEPFNRNAATRFFWDGRLELRGDGTIVSPVPLPDGIETLLEAQALLPLLDRGEMRGEPGETSADGRPNELGEIPDEEPEAVWAAVLERLLALEGYQDAFALAFPGEEIGIEHVAIAIAAFESRLWELTDTAFDDFLGSVSEPGRDDALSEAQLRGARLFFGEAGCSRCHSGPLLSDERFHNIAVPPIGEDLGRERVSGDRADRFAFRTPPLRNVALTAPYMHDGAYGTLFEAVSHHLEPERWLRSFRRDRLPEDLRPLLRDDRETIEALLGTIDPELAPDRALDEGAVADLIAFLGALSSNVELEVPAGGGAPLAVPSGLPIDRPEDLGEGAPEHHASESR